MDNSDKIELVGDNTQGQSVEQESEEMRKLRQQLSDVYQAWVSGRPPPQGPSEGTSTIPQATQTPLHATSDPILPPGYVPNYSLHTAPGTSNMRPPVAPVRNTPLVVSGAPAYTIPPPPPVTRPNNEPPSHAYNCQYYSPNMAFGVSAPYNQTPQYESPVENEKPATRVEPDEMARKMKSLEQNIKNIQGLGGHKSVSFTCEWFIDQDISHWHVWDDMAQAFVKQFQYNIDIAPDRDSLSNMKKKPTESFREYAIKWREQAARNMMSAMGRPFEEAIKIGEMVENGLKTGRIVSQAALKATTQAIQNGLGGLANRKKRDEGSMMASGSREFQRGASHPYVQVQQGQSSYPQHYYPPPIPQYSVGPPQYTVFNAQPYARPLTQQVRAPAPRAPRPQQQNFRAPYNARPRQDYGREQRPVEKFTPLAESYSSLFQKLKQMGVIGPIAPHHMHPDSHGFQANARCEYHSGAPGQSTDNCWTLKRAIERLIFEKLIVVTNGEDPPNVTNNPLPAHNDVHFVGMIGRHQEYKPVGLAEMTVGAIQEGAGLEVSPSQDVPLIVKGAQNSNKATLFVPKISRLEVQSSVPSPRLYVLGGHPVKREKQGGTKGITEPIVIKPAVQLPVTNTKTTPWNYNKTVKTYKGKEIMEEVGETGGFTRSGRCYSPEELRKAKQIREGHLPIKKPVTEADVEEFLKKMKVQDYSIIDQLRKTTCTNLSTISAHTFQRACPCTNQGPERGTYLRGDHSESVREDGQQIF
ncbi:PREDICTED: uncharacterized protein LOC109221800 [Nicotiana attenuata]|uniref:uncharacterized protein LOC109221800 n=1 Tax=Nicotiana attenuata TaxID=49451 RepID=UPI000905CB48|nr:PREDICTED: uncharacterized protein LOC109221800 [Nicotiana attenuata]